MVDYQTAQWKVFKKNMLCLVVFQYVRDILQVTVFFSLMYDIIPLPFGIVVHHDGIFEKGYICIPQLLKVELIETRIRKYNSCALLLDKIG